MNGYPHPALSQDLGSEVAATARGLVDTVLPRSGLGLAGQWQAEHLKPGGWGRVWGGVGGRREGWGNVVRGAGAGGGDAAQHAVRGGELGRADSYGRGDSAG